MLAGVSNRDHSRSHRGAEFDKISRRLHRREALKKKPSAIRSTRTPANTPDPASAATLRGLLQRLDTGELSRLVDL